MRRIKLSIVILNYNTKDLLEKCLGFIRKAESKTSTEVIVVDNGSVDGSVDLVKNKFSWVKIIENARNVGFAAGNNLAKNKCQGEYVLFLNSDAFISENVLKEGIGYLDRNPDVGALTCKLVLASGKLDKDARRSFPTPWVFPEIPDFCSILVRIFAFR
jgi:GT2 family glycosyltransferase